MYIEEYACHLWTDEILVMQSEPEPQFSCLFDCLIFDEMQ